MALAIVAGGCDIEEPTGAGTGKKVNNGNLDKVFDASGEGYEGAQVRLVGQAYDREADLLLVWGDPDKVEKPLQITGETEGVSADDYVLIKGTLTGAGSYETVLGANEETLDIDATSIKEISEERVSKLANPTTAKEVFNGKQTKAGFTVKVKSMTWTDKVTRMAIEATNNSKDSVTLSASDTAIKQGSKQYDQNFDEETDFTSEFDSDIRPGVTKKGTLVFDRVKRKPPEAEIEFEWYSDDFDLTDPKPFKFELTW
jgi:hypothetical protein